VGEAPLWYRVLRAAKFLGVAPWDLAEAPYTWMEQAEAAQAAEHSAEQARKDRGSQPARRRGASRTR
jgi:hypothetical protein